MRPDFVFSDVSVSPSFFFTTPVKNPRTECGCHPVVFEIAAMVVPPLARSRPSTRSCLVILRAVRGPCVAFVLILDRFADFERERVFALVLIMGTSEVGDTIVAPPRPR